MTIQKEQIEMPIVDDRLTDLDSSSPNKSEELARQQAIKQIERRRHFRIGAVVSAIGMAILVLIWAMSEYHNAGGWPSQGFSQSSGIHDVWNYWIVYPIGAWLLILGAHAWFVYGHKPISEIEIQREIERQAGTR
ncbi:MAG TPA: 2TM domain-containing protein [Acidimicrobiales bacterium]|nr:2TM domain-containing protein [Acidimicrobiales bacterium]